MDLFIDERNQAAQLSKNKTTFEIIKKGKGLHFGKSIYEHYLFQLKSS